MALLSPLVWLVITESGHKNFSDNQTRALVLSLMIMTKLPMMYILQLFLAQLLRGKISLKCRDWNVTVFL